MYVYNIYIIQRYVYRPVKQNHKTTARAIKQRSYELTFYLDVHFELTILTGFGSKMQIN